MSSPSRPASHALMTLPTSLRLSSRVMTVICLRERSSRTTRRKLSGTIGRSDIRHFLYFASYSSGSASCTRWPTAQVTMCSSDSREPSCLVNEPGSTPVRSRPTDGFSAMTSVLAMCRSRLAALSAGAGTCRDRLARARENPPDDRVRDAVAAPGAGRRGGEDRRHDAAAAVDHRAARVARAHHAAQRYEAALDRAVPVGVLGHG